MIQWGDVLPPGRMDRRLPTRVRSESNMPLAAATLRVAMHFTDSGGRRWSRAHNGVLIDHGPWQQTPEPALGALWQR